MTQTFPVFLAGTILLLLCAIPANGIVWTYRHVPWRTSRLGRVMFTKSASLALVLDFSLIGAVLVLFDWGRPWWFEVTRLCIFATVGIALWAQWAVYRAILEQAQRVVPPSDEPELNGHTFS